MISFCFLKYFTCSKNQLFELTQFSCHNFTFLHVVIVEVNCRDESQNVYWTVSPLCPSNEVQLHSTGGIGMGVVWYSSKQYLQHQLLPWLGQMVSKSMRKGYKLSVNREVLRLLSQLVIYLFFESLYDDNVFREPCL